MLLGGPISPNLPNGSRPLQTPSRGHFRRRPAWESPQPVQTPPAAILEVWRAFSGPKSGVLSLSPALARICPNNVGQLTGCWSDPLKPAPPAHVPRSRSHHDVHRPFPSRALPANESLNRLRPRDVANERSTWRLQEPIQHTFFNLSCDEIIAKSRGILVFSINRPRFADNDKCHARQIPRGRRWL
jgi:hypothetical protein